MQLVRQIKKLKQGSIGKKVDKRLREFSSLGKKGNQDLFKEMCFCLLTANYTAEGGIRIQKAIDHGLE